MGSPRWEIGHCGRTMSVHKFLVVALMAASATSLPARLDTAAGPRVNFDCSPGYSVEQLRADVRQQPRDLAQLHFINCDLSTLDFYFLGDYPDLFYLSVDGGSLVQFNGMPVVSGLRDVRVATTDFRRWYDASRTPKLNSVHLGRVAGDAVVDQLLDSLSAYNDSLRYLHLERSELTRVPSKVNLFGKLSAFHFTANRRTTALTAGTFPATFTPDVINIQNCGITTVETGAFEGDFAERKVYLLDAEMERLDEEVFGPVLRSMEDAKSGALFLDRVGQCGCGLSWLNRDNPKLLAYINARCYQPSVGWINVWELNTDDFDKCPGP